MIIDTNVLVAFLDMDDPRNDSVARCLTDPRLVSVYNPPVVSPYVLAELDYLVMKRTGVKAELAALRALTDGTWELASMTVGDVGRSIELIERYADQNIGLADASNVVLADRYRTTTIATFDRRHFEAVRPLSGGWFTIVPDL